MPMEQLAPYDYKSFGDEVLNSIVEWVGANLDVGQVYGLDIIKEYLESQGYTVEES